MPSGRIHARGAWRKPALVAGALSLLVLAVGGAGWWAWSTGRLAALGPEVARTAIAPKAAHVAAADIPLAAHITVDQFGYRPDDDKVAVVRNPKRGFDADQAFLPGATYELRRADDGKVAASAPLQPWSNGAVQESSGDQGWWFDFSQVRAPGDYMVVDVAKNVRSPVFAIRADVYQPVLRAAVRTFYYQRSGFAKKPPHAEACWADDAAYLGSRQETEARDVKDKDNAASARELSGGWFDAGDTNKYVTFAAPVIHQLLGAWRDAPAAFTDDFGIPESGNGIPDLIDELKWETDWVKKMQNGDGSLLLKMGETEFGRTAPPSSDKRPRFYLGACSSSTIAGAGIFAHAAAMYARLPQLAADAADLRARAIRAWDRFHAMRKDTNCDKGEVKSGDADLSEEDQWGTAVTAAVYLFAATGDRTYERWLAENLHKAKPYRDLGWTRYNADQGEALLFYTTLAEADGELRARILADKRRDVATHTAVYGLRPGDDLYRAYLTDDQYHWGSHQVRANFGSSNLDAIRFRSISGDPKPYIERALGIVHYFHGVNPFAIVYLSNMYGLGATRSVDTLWHGWFAPKTRWADARGSECGPPPGYVTGGPNAQAGNNGVPATMKPPVDQPRQKAWRDYNLGWPDAAWVVNEPAIYYQAAYIRLLAGFAQAGGPAQAPPPTLAAAAAGGPATAAAAAAPAAAATAAPAASPASGAPTAAPAAVAPVNAAPPGSPAAEAAASHQRR